MYTALLEHWPSEAGVPRTHPAPKHVRLNDLVTDLLHSCAYQKPATLCKAMPPMARKSAGLSGERGVGW